MQVQPYLFFDGHCEEAIEFYKQVLGAQVDMMMRYKESPDPMPPGTVPPGYDDKIMHTSFRVGESPVMASDSCNKQPGFKGFSLSISVADAGEAERVFDALAQGGSVQMPLAKTFWSPCFGMLTDRFGVAWMINAMA